MFIKKREAFLKQVKFLFGWPLGIIALFFIVRLIYPQWGRLSEAIQKTNITLLLCGTGCLLLYFLIRSVLWHLLIQPYAKVAFKQTAYYWAYAELKRYIPGSIVSIASRVIHFSDQGMEKKEVGKAYLAEVQLIILGSGIVSLGGLPLLQHGNFFSIWSFLLIALVVCFLLAFLFQNRLFSLSKIAKLQSLQLPGSYSHRLLLIGLSITSFFFFGIGHFFILVSLFHFNLQLIYIVTGFFVFSYLIGYLSFITPSGIGVREGLIIGGLQSFIGAAAAGFAAIFSRIVLLLAEVLFFLCLFLWKKLNFVFLAKLETFCRRHNHVIVLLLLIFIYCLYFTTTSFLRYDNFYTGRFDLGNMDQTVWNTFHGRIFQLTDPNGTYSVSRLATHADFILILLAPLYSFWSDPRMLLFLQTIIVGVGAIYVYLLGVFILKNKPLALVFAFMYLLNPSVERTNLYDFHAVTLATTFLLAAFYYMLKKRYVCFIIFAILAGSTKEQVWFIEALLGFFIAFKQKKYLLGTSIFVIGTAISYYLIGFAIPTALGSQHFALSYYSDFGDSPSSIIKNIFLSPGKTLSTIFATDRLHYLEQIFLPLGGLSFLAPLYLLFSFPELFIYLLSNNPNLHQIYYQYTATITPFLFLSAMYGLARLRRWLPKISVTTFAIVLVAIALITSYFYGPLPGEKEPNTDMYTKQLADKNAIQNFLMHIPKRLSVASSNNLGSHLSHRRNIYTIPVGVDQADVLAFLLTDPSAQPSVQFHKDLTAKLKTDPRYTVWYKIDDFIVFKKITH